MPETDRPVLSKEEIDRIMSLPERKFKFSGLYRSGRFDEESMKFYLTDQNGRLTGHIATINIANRTQGPQGTVSNKTAQQNVEKRADIYTVIRKILKLNNDDTLQQKQNQPAASPKQIRTFAILAVVMVAAVCLFVFIGPFGSKATKAQVSSEGDTPFVLLDVEADGVNTIAIAQTVRDLIPGDAIEADDIRQAVVASSTYNNLSFGSAQLYRWDQRDVLIGQYAKEFIPAEWFLNYKNVGSVYQPPVNPWWNEQDGFQYVMIPLMQKAADNQYLNYGAIVNLTVKRSTLHGSDRLEQDDSNHSAVEESYVVDTYQLPKCIVCDIYNGDKTSLYYTYASWLGIPSGERERYLTARFTENSELGSKLRPAYIAVKLSNEQVAQIGDLNYGDVTIDIAFTQDVDATTTTKAEFAADIRSLFQVLTSAQATATEKRG